MGIRSPVSKSGANMTGSTSREMYVYIRSFTVTAMGKGREALVDIPVALPVT